jgi:hypothetical protein
MAVAVEVNYRGVTTSQFDEAIKTIGAVPGGRHPGGVLFHWAAKTSDGIRVTDVWSTREQFDRFRQDVIIPSSKKAGLPDPEIRFVDVHEYMTAS